MNKPSLTYLGRSSVKITTCKNHVIYIDPYAGDSSDYHDSADLVLVTHQHSDHNAVNRVTMKKDGVVLQCPMDIGAGVHKKVFGIDIKAVKAYNSNHKESECCGFILNADDIIIYHSGDTSTTDEMLNFKNLHIGYALLNMDGFYNMGPEEAMKVTELIKPKHVIPIHTSKSGDYDKKTIDLFTSPLKIAMKCKDVIFLSKE